MNIKEFLDLYDINKEGLINEKDKICTCGKKLGESTICGDCRKQIKKSQFLNVAKNAPLGKRYEVDVVGNDYMFKYYQLLSSGFDLYESEVLRFTLNKETADVTISNSKIFKTIDKRPEFTEFMNTYFNGFLDYVYSCLREFKYEYSKSNFTSLTESEIKNMLHIFLNYNAISKCLRGYKVFYYGSKVNLKKYYDIDFNKEEEVEKIDLNTNLLLTWDLKNEKYIESIIDISKNEPLKKQNTLLSIMSNMLNDNRSSETYNNTFNVFGLLYNKEISLDDFIRIYNNSRDNYFNQLFEYRKLHKKMVSKAIDWSTIDSIDRKTINTLTKKEFMKKEMKYSSAKINKSYEILGKDPLEALKFLMED